MKSPSDLKARADDLLDAIREQWRASRPTRRSRRIGPSWLGADCERAAWAKYRWLDSPDAPDGRMLRLFDTGDREEERFVADLRATGAEVRDRAEHDPRRQISVTDLDGALFGYVDALARGVRGAPTSDWVVCEFKTANLKSWKSLFAKGLAQAKPEHRDQMLYYLDLLGLQWGLYLCKCKDDEHLHIEWVRADPDRVAELRRRAGRIANLDSRSPAKISDRADWWRCKLCPAKSWCHDETPPPRTCRSCDHARVDGGVWRCALYGLDLKPADQEAGCGMHLFRETALPWLEWIEGDPETGGVGWNRYLDAKKREWIDRGPNHPFAAAAPEGA